MWPLIFIAISIALAQDTGPIVDIPSLGKVRGSIGQTTWTGQTINQYRSIPYAEAPIGKLRFQAPVAKKGWNSTLDGSEHGSQCPQLSDSDPNEDCLTLSVYTKDINESRPVMFYIHGGWFIFGAASSYQSNNLLESDIVLVVIQYRLGPLGFLSMENEQIPGNVAILDMILALEWVQTNIGYFGGNNSQVTIFGESAGSVGVSALLLTPLLQNRPVALFHRAILQSGSVFSPWAMSRNPVEGTHEIALRVGCAENNIESCLKETPVKALLKAFVGHRKDNIIDKGYPYVTGSTIVAGDFLGVFPLHPRNYLRNLSSDVAIMAGSTSQDGLFLLEDIDQLQPKLINSINNTYEILQFIQLLHEKFGLAELDGTLEAYELAYNFVNATTDQVSLREAILGFIDICGNHGIKAPTLNILLAASRINPNNSYLYSFDFGNRGISRITHLPISLDEPVRHAQDLFYLFPMIPLDGTDIKIAKTMTELWTSFACHGLPKAKEVQHWPPASKLYGPYLKINDPSTIGENYFTEFSATLNKFGTI
ncbi:glutactin-like [Uranotaenia lowii]|uniref:glutactin-like n=1 Tax=Uranotaenia lowii TaxID=190385 RepID=UPI002479A943|nr:glutactin-like [Uranotaenia lowii]